MAAVANDRAHFFLQQSLSELLELERKKIFISEEIRAISKKRAQFEIQTSGPKCSAATYMRYIEYETNLEALRSKRAHRLNLNHGYYQGQRRLFWLHKRATKNHSQDLSLWRGYIDYAKKQGASKLLSSVFTMMLRLNPTKPELWVLAAQTTLDSENDFTKARNFLQRGLTFCKKSKLLWQAYAELEVAFVKEMVKKHKNMRIEHDTTTTTKLNESFGEGGDYDRDHNQDHDHDQDNCSGKNRGHHSDLANNTQTQQKVKESDISWKEMDVIAV